MLVPQHACRSTLVQSYVSACNATAARARGYSEWGLLLEQISRRMLQHLKRAFVLSVLLYAWILSFTNVQTAVV